MDLGDELQVETTKMTIMAVKGLINKKICCKLFYCVTSCRFTVLPSIQYEDIGKFIFTKVNTVRSLMW